jgi:uncharacterized membrane protein YoaK (UPF0700 family)
MAEESRNSKESELAKVAKLSGLSFVTEIILLLVGAAILGAAYKSEMHLLAVVVVIPLVWYAYAKFFKG